MNSKMFASLVPGLILVGCGFGAVPQEPSNRNVHHVKIPDEQMLSEGDKSAIRDVLMAEHDLAISYQLRSLRYCNILPQGIDKNLVAANFSEMKDFEQDEMLSVILQKEAGHWKIVNRYGLFEGIPLNGRFSHREVHQIIDAVSRSPLFDKEYTITGIFVRDYIHFDNLHSPFVHTTHAVQTERLIDVRGVKVPTGEIINIFVKVDSGKVVILGKNVQVFEY